MANSMASGTTSINDTLQQITESGINTLGAIIRDYSAMAYLLFDDVNIFENGGKMMKGTGFTYKQVTEPNFKSVAMIEDTLQLTDNSVEWYESDIVNPIAIVDGNKTNSTTFVVTAATVKYLKVDDKIIITGGENNLDQDDLIRTITAINTSTRVITVDSGVTIKSGDRVQMLYHRIEEGTKITREGDVEDPTRCRVFFQRFGANVSFKATEINLHRLLVTPEQFVLRKFSAGIRKANQSLQGGMYNGQNVSGAKSEMQGLDTLISEKDAKDGAGSCIHNMKSLVTSKALNTPLKILNYLVTDIFDKAYQAPVYQGNEGPTVFCNDKFISELSVLFNDAKNSMGGAVLEKDTIAFGITRFTSIYFKNIDFIVDKYLNTRFPYYSVAFLFPKHLVSFKVPKFMGVDENAKMIANRPGLYHVHKITKDSVEVQEYTILMLLAICWGGQTFPNTYKKIIRVNGK